MSSQKMDTFRIQDGKYVVEKEIGKGSFATVYRGHVTTDPKSHIAVKAVARSKLKNKKLLENLEIEIAILKKIKHPHIVGLIDCERTTTDFYLVMDYCALGDLTFLIKKRKELENNHPLLQTVFNKYPPPSKEHNGLNRAFVVCYLQQLASALKFLRSKNLVHRDIKSQNLLLATPLTNYRDSKTFHELGYVGIYNLPILKIADFGFARFLPSTSLAETLCGSPLYMAPEILNYQKYNAKADLWSVGTVLFEMCCGVPPFTASNHLELFKKIKRAHDEINFPEVCEVEDGLKELICSLLTFDPAKRIGFEEFFNNKIVTEDLSHYEVDENTELESKSKDLQESNMFVSEFLIKKRNQKGVSSRKDAEFIPKSKQEPMLDQAYKDETEMETGVKYGVNIAPEVYQNEMIDPEKLAAKLIAAKQLGSDEKLTNKNISHLLSSNSSRVNKLDKSNLSGKSDSSLDRDYVVVEKKAVEVNSLADDLAQANVGNNDEAVKDQNIKTLEQPHIQVHQPHNDIQNLQRAPSTTSGGTSSRRASLVERRLSISSLNPSNALSRALGLASTRIFGSSAQTNKNQTSNSTSPNYTQPLLNSQIFYDLTENLILHTETLNQPALINVDHAKGINEVIRILESLSAKAFVVYSYAEVKYAQIIPLPQAVIRASPALQFEKRLSDDSNPVIDEDSDEELDVQKNLSNTLLSETVNTRYRLRNDSSRNSYNKRNSFNKERFSFSSQGSNNSKRTNSYSSTLLPAEIISISKEAIVLYMKALQILAQSMKITSKWWYSCQEKICSLRLNILVQWIREKFNECLDKTDFLRIKLEEYENSKPGTHNQSPKSKISNDSNEDNVAEKVYLEKLLYDRALEISKYAANLELQGQNLHICELAYATSLWMLTISLENSPYTDQGEDEYDEFLKDTNDVLDSEDKIIIGKYIKSISHRLKMLRQKMAKY